MHFLLQCNKYAQTRDKFFKEIIISLPHFPQMTNPEKLAVMLGEGHTAPLAAQYVAACQNLRDTQ
ncbi:UNVERIFIED_CONTAM: hypothetical protein FKN15_039709 [Acipenser sinensis]